ncbi:hypothetical protein BU25DRAFT_389419 [Macroventuria anomochaeta]|uniref:Uncharacterized protein n=1 Tax=Macroventuria anomochaeta TaxID=301207 RepID=A0ACB6S5L8_9PLEO|nr:uncharacterized protein BU25DRAFT_389419 [Macroventuria anomochaeta]KAF2629328.1 hypothetical protein BU25DRAFT_389419 [Macroventuria anomochaeta]
MAAPNLDTNQWYSMYINNYNTSSMLSTSLYTRSGTAGAVFFNFTNHDSATQRWQIFPINSTTVVLRTKEGGANGFIGAQPADSNGEISPLMLRGDVADDSVFWQFGSWGDGTWYLYNSANGTDYHLANKNGQVRMDNNITAPQNLQRFSFDSVAAINDEAYSSVNLLSATVTSPGTLSATASATASATSSFAATSTSTSTPTPSTGLSTAGKAGIAAALGIAALIALVALGLIHRQKRNRKRISKPQESAYEPYQGQPQGAVEVAPTLPERRAEHFKHELDHGSTEAKYEMPSQTVTETEGHRPMQPAELPGSYERR